MELWNCVPENVKQSTSISELKRYLSDSDTTLPSSDYTGKRKEQITHCRLRLEMSNLDNDLKRRHLTTNPACIGRHHCESTGHFLFLSFYFSALNMLISAQAQYLPS